MPKIIDWKEIARVLKYHMAQQSPEIKIRDVQGWFDLSSTGHAEYYLTKLEEKGFVRSVIVGVYRKWFFDYGKGE